MNTHDRAFLQDITQFIAMNRVATVYTLFKGLCDLEDVAKFTVSKIWMEEVIVNDVTQFGDTGRMQRILIAKIYAELMSAYEDLGSFCEAIKNRKSQRRPGIFRRCLSGDTRQAAQFLDDMFKSDILNHPEIGLDIILQLPTIKELSVHLQQNMLIDIDQVYREIPQKLYDVAMHYRAKRQFTTAIEAKDLSTTDTRNDVTILLGIITPNEAVKNSGVNVDAFNKTKHQFLITENLSKYSDPTAGYQIEFGRFGMSEGFVTLLIQNTIAVAQIIRILANVLLTLDEMGVEI